MERLNGRSLSVVADAERFAVSQFIRSGTELVFRACDLPADRGTKHGRFSQGVGGSDSSTRDIADIFCMGRGKGTGSGGVPGGAVTVAGGRLAGVLRSGAKGEVAEVS